jgi:putative chitinase
MTFSDRDWLQALEALGVRATTAPKWNTAFADEVQPEKFSAGMADLRAWLAQILHEHSMLERTEESLSYNPERMCAVWPSRFPTLSSAVPYTHSPQKLANFVYANRMGNGPPESGDGWRYRGRPMLTGKNTYMRVGDRIGQDLLDDPELLEQPHYVLIAEIGWWEDTIPDTCLSDQAKIRRRVQGDTLGLEHCQALYDKTLQVFA